MISICQNVNNYITYGQMNINNDFRKIWTELAFWMKIFMISIDNNSNDLNAISERLYRVPGDFYYKLEVFFGPILSQQFVTLFTNHIVIAMQLANATKNNDPQAIDHHTTAWYKNADDLSSFLAQITFAWNKGQWNNLFFQYISMTIEEMVARFSGDYNKQVLINDRVIIHALIMADYMANGIIQHVMLREIESANSKNRIDSNCMTK